MTKTLTFKFKGKNEVLKYVDGVLDRPEMLAKLTSENSDWVGVKCDSGGYLSYLPTRSKKSAPLKVIKAFDCSFSPVKIDTPKAEAKEKVVVEKKAKVRVVIDPKLIAEVKVLALEGKTISQISEELGQSQYVITKIGKAENIGFTKGHKGRVAKGEKKPDDPELVAKIKALALEGKTVTQAFKALGVAWYVVVAIAKKEGIEFVKGKRGRAKA